jgi:hypothetical protein
LPFVSVWTSEPRRCQYSVEVWVWMTSGSVSGRLSSASVFPVKWSVDCAYEKGKASP